MKNQRQPKPCESCGKIMMVPPCYMHRKRFCSRQCLGRHENVKHIADVQRVVNKGSFKKGEHLDRAHPRFVEPIAMNCEYCGNPFERKPWELRQRGHKGRFCSKECRGKYRTEFASGPNAPDWVGGPKTYRGRGWQTMRKIVVADQNGRCAQCNKHVGDSLPVHHIRPFREFATATDANARANLIGLCQSCHMHMEPRLYSKKSM